MNAATHHDRRRMAVQHYEQLARIGRALANPARLRLVDLLRQGPRTVELLAENAQLSFANTSQHLQQLKSAGLVVSIKRAQKVEYRLAAEGVGLLFSTMRALAETVLPEMDRLARGMDLHAEEDRTALLEKIRARKVSLIDVRPLEEYRAGHLAGSRSIPLDELEHRLDELPRGKEVVAYCRGPYCPMALEAVEVLEAAGFRACHLDLGAPDLASPPWQLVVSEGEAQADRSTTKPSRRKR